MTNPTNREIRQVSRRLYEQWIFPKSNWASITPNPHSNPDLTSVAARYYLGAISYLEMAERLGETTASQVRNLW